MLNTISIIPLIAALIYGVIPNNNDIIAVVTVANMITINSNITSTIILFY
ncbi:hypothetical protein [Brachyspira sp. G79]|nr:hypothetical protein [Brachyspira sp. G79]